MLKFIWNICIVNIFEVYFDEPMTEIIESFNTKSDFLEVIIWILFTLIYGVIKAIYTFFGMISSTIQALLFKKVYLGSIDGNKYYVTINKK